MICCRCEDSTPLSVLLGTACPTPLAALLRPAALQCAWLAHPGTTGAEFVDYLIKDQVVAPPEIAQPFIREGLVYMKHHYQVRSSR